MPVSEVEPLEYFRHASYSGHSRTPAKNPLDLLLFSSRPRQIIWFNEIIIEAMTFIYASLHSRVI